MTLTSERLVYTQVTLAEKENYMRWYTDNAVMQYITGTGLTNEQAEARFAKTLQTNEAYPTMGFYVVKNEANGEFIGIAKFTYLDDAHTQAEVGYGMMPEYWGMGYGSEMLRCLVAYARSFSDIKELIGIVNPENDASIRVLTKQGFSLCQATFGEAPTEHYKLELKP